MKKGTSQMMWVIIGAALGIMVFVVFSFLTGGVVRKLAHQFGVVHDDADARIRCTVIPPGIKDDYNGDGIRDIPECDQFKKTEGPPDEESNGAS